MSLRDTSPDGKVEAVVVHGSNYGSGSRDVCVLDWKSSKRVWALWMGALPHGVLISDVDGAGRSEILVGTLAPDNGDSTDGANDGQACALLLDANGRIRRIRPRRTGFGTRTANR